jgi:hypothetical protein
MGAGRSLYVAMPRAWCAAVGIEKGTILTMVFGSILIVFPPGQEESVQSVLARLPAEVP